MKKIFNSGFFALMMLTILASCKKEGTLNANLSIMDQRNTDKTSTDVWLDNNYLNPYNIEVKYKFDRFELALGKDITPPLESQVIPAMGMVKEAWIKPYEAVGGTNFIKKISPKQFILAGSAEYNSNGSITLGTAEGGRKIVLYVINTFDKTNLASVKQMIQVIQHEYTHILNQTVDFQPDFQTISRGGYESNWTQRPLSEAYSLGFITQYSRVSPVEDFAEMTANMLMMGRVQYNSIVNAAPADGQAKLKKKETYVVDYFKSAFNIDFYALQTQVQNSLNTVSAPVLAKMIGPAIGYTSIYSNPSADTQQSTEFSGLWNKAKAGIAAQNYILKDIKMTFKANNAMTLTYSVSTTDGKSTYYADADYTMTIDAQNIATLTLLATQPTTATYNNMSAFNNSLAPVNNYFKGNKFKVDWINQLIPGQIGVLNSLGAFYKSTDASSYFYGVMGF